MRPECKHQAAEDLHVEVAHPEAALADLAHDRERSASMSSSGSPRSSRSLKARRARRQRRVVHRGDVGLEAR
jgi:hypothetical protein